jgi:hypothetical protein
MAAEHSPQYRTIAEQLSAYIDIAVTEPMPDWSPPWTWGGDELPMEVLFDYDEAFPLPAGLDAILGISEVSKQVLRDFLYMPE